MSTNRCLGKLTESTFIVTKNPLYEECIKQPIDNYSPLQTRTENLTDTRTQKEIDIDNSFYKVRKRSAEAWKESFFTEITDPSVTVHKSYHDVRKIMRKGKLAFLKLNAINSPMSELETTICQFYRLIAPDLIPKMHTSYNKIGIMGNASKGIDFKSIRDEPLTPDILNIEALTNKEVTIGELKQLYRLYKMQNNYKLSMKADNELLSFTLSGKQISLKASDLKHFEILRALAIVLVLSYLFEEDDLHCGNLSKKNRIDFDMSLWSIVHHFKNMGMSKFIDRALRTPSPDQFIITDTDIINFPKLTNALPFHWPIFSEEGYVKYVARWVTGMASSVFAVTSNTYPASVSSTFAQLATNSVFEEIKYDTFLMFCLVPHEAYQNIAEAEINSEVTMPNSTTSIIYDITQHLKERTERCKSVLCNIATFRQHVKKMGKVS